MTDTSDRFAIIPLPAGHAPAPDEAIVVGSMSAVMENIVDSHARNDALEQAAQAVVDAEEAKELAAEAKRLQDMARTNTVQMITDTITRVASRLDAFIARRDAEEEEAEAKRIQAQLDALPDPDSPDPLAHQNTGDLHVLTPSHTAKAEQDQTEFELPEDLTGVSIPQPVSFEFDEQ